MARRQSHFTFLVLLVFAFLLGVTYIFSVPSQDQQPVLNQAAASKGGAVTFEESKAASAAKEQAADGKSQFALDLDDVSASGILGGESIAPKLENATLKAELGRATWKFLHTMVARFPDTPTQTDRTTLETFFHLFGRLYPCGDCARHFREMLKTYPPQTSSRSNAAGWLCFVHNVVNERLEKEIFDCNNIGDFYDCGCGDEGEKKKTTEGEAPEPQESGQVQEEIKREDDGEVTMEERIQAQVNEVDEGKQQKEESGKENTPSGDNKEDAVEKIRT